MYCSNCGKKLPDGVTVCSDCNPAPQVKAEKVSPVETKETFFKMPSKGSKSYAALFTAMLVFPATICTAIDIAFDKYDYWFGYVVGALIVTWVIAVLPVLKVTSPAITALICFGSIIGYTYFIMSKTEFFNWLPKFLLPIYILTAAFIALDVALIGGKKITGLRTISLLSLECALYLIGWEVVYDNAKFGSIDLGWSLILACGFISIVAVIEAFSYIGRINKK